MKLELSLETSKRSEIVVKPEP
eukprot:SAG31_NODE_41357_length_276_cov_0.881356_1_plen_21_part_10